MKVTFRISTESEGTAVNKGGQVPPWASAKNSEEYKNKAYKDESIGYPYFYNLVKRTEEKYDLYVQYGHNVENWAGIRFFKMSFEIESIEDQIVSYNITPKQISLVRTDFARGGWIAHSIYKFGDYKILEYTRNTQEEFYYGEDDLPKYNTKETVSPQGYSQDSMISLSTEYPGGEADSSLVKFGISIFNEQPIEYYPGLIAKGKKWLSIEKNSKKIWKRKDNITPKDKKIEEGDDNKGHYRTRKSKTWKQSKEENDKERE